MVDTGAIEICEIVGQRQFPGTSLFEMVLDCPTCALQVQPGQFVHLGLPQPSQHILRRPLSVYQTDIVFGTITLLYQVMGAGTELLSQLGAGTQLDLIGPLGRGWQPQEAQSCLVIGGGVGAAPLFLLVKQLLEKGVEVDLILGAATAKLLVCEASFKALLARRSLFITTDDGSKGFHGFTTELAASRLAESSYDYLAACGPEPMLQAVAKLTADTGIRTELSLERRMACGIGVCLSCVVETTAGKKRSCVDGPVFAAEEVCW